MKSIILTKVLLKRRGFEASQVQPHGFGNNKIITSVKTPAYAIIGIISSCINIAGMLAVKLFG